MDGIGLEFDPPGNTNFGFIEGLFVNSSGAFTPRTTDRFIENRIHNWNSYLNAQIWMNGINAEDQAAFPFNASVAVTGSSSVAQIASSWTPNYSAAACSGGASQYTYTLVAVDGNGGQSASSTFSTNSLCTNPLTSGNPATLNPGGGVTTSLVFTEAVRIDVYRTGGPMATGKIGSLTCANDLRLNSCSAFVDSGLSATTAVPTIDTTGSNSAYKTLTISNCAASGTAANPSVVACAAAAAGIVYCDIAASAGTCTVNTSAVTTNSEISIQPSGADGTLLSKTCNTAPSVVPFALLGAKSNGVSFTINMPTGTTNGFCFEYTITN